MVLPEAYGSSWDEWSVAWVLSPHFVPGGTAGNIHRSGPIVYVQTGRPGSVQVHRSCSYTPAFDCGGPTVERGCVTACFNTSAESPYADTVADQISSTPELRGYVREVSLRDDEILRDLRAETAALPMGRAMQVMAEEGQLLTLLVHLTGARTVLEVGTFTGYSTLCLARALPRDGRLITCDISGKWPRIATGYWQRAGVQERIEVRIGDAVETLETLLAELGPDSVDFAFIDADKANYRVYYEACLALVRPGGLIVVDNTLFFGRVVDPSLHDPDTVAVRELNMLLRDDDRVEISLLTMADGVTLVRRRPADERARRG